MERVGMEGRGGILCLLLLLALPLCKAEDAPGSGAHGGSTSPSYMALHKEILDFTGQAGEYP
ncbi:hypothetical protein GDO78_015484 [Eleutherodactylus coqui]|uniref:Uncharacterized protein n=1 Tax=Eleutherodactylus coqui TaxID=57060 RepID=A0A8J6BEW7_ELECQ|nr:hypothetical protein GDO78_015484 [Eleutherodactylus coqui]